MENLRFTGRTDKLIGQTISSTQIIGCENGDRCDGVNTLILTFTDGSTLKIAGFYGGYTGESCDEYPEFINVFYKPKYKTISGGVKIVSVGLK